jgi:hypothetical protein
MRVCIVGASGKLGKYMVRHALDRGYEVVGVCREKSVGKLDAFKGRITVVAGDTDDREVIGRAVRGCDGVLTVLVPWGVRDYASGTARAVLELAEPGARLVFSCGWHITRDGRTSTRGGSSCAGRSRSSSRVMRWLRVADLDDQVRACRRDLRQRHGGGLSCACSTCSRTPPARACTSATPRATPPPTSSPLQAHAGLQRAAPDGLGRLRPARRAVRHQNRHSTRAITTKAQHRELPRQIKRLGFSYDWDREVNTTDPGYYKWTQWIFLKLFEKGLAYSKPRCPVNWCPPELGTVLANEEVIDGKSETGGPGRAPPPCASGCCASPPTPSACSNDLDGLDWPEGRIKEMQRNWIGRSEGAEVDFAGRRHDETITVFTTRPDTLFGATYMVLAPEHRSWKLTTDRGQRAAVEAYRERPPPARATGAHRALAKEKTGVFTGAYAINPVNGERDPDLDRRLRARWATAPAPSWPCPAHDERDFEFAQEVRACPSSEVVQPAGRHDMARGLHGDGTR